MYLNLFSLLKSTILDLACRLQDFNCLTNASYYWPIVYNSLQDPSKPNTFDFLLLFTRIHVIYCFNYN